MNEFDAARAAVEAVPKRLFVGGEWRDARSGRTFEVEDPATGKTLCSVADATPRTAWRRWRRPSRHSRPGPVRCRASAVRSCGAPTTC